MLRLNREIELNRIIGEMAGTLRGIIPLQGDIIDAAVFKRIMEIIKRYDDFFKGEK